MDDAAPLFPTPDNPLPPGGEAAWIRGAGGAKLRAAIFRPTGQPRGTIVLSGGRTEVIEKYFETIGDFLDRGFVVLTHDWRGQGLSHRELGDRLKGHASGGYKSFLEDWRALMAAYASQMPKPWIAVGHSMGGCLTLLALANGEDRFAGAVLSAPMLGLLTAPHSPAAARMAARSNLLLGRAARYARPSRGPLDAEFEANILTHDPVRYARNCGITAAHPDLALGGPTWGWIDFAFRATAFLARGDKLRQITLPVTIVSAGEERLVDNSAQAAAARQLPQGKLVNVPGAYHEILMETDPMRNIFLRTLDMLTGRAAPQPAAAPKSAAAPAASAPAPAPAAEAKPAEAPKPAAAPAKAAAPAASKPAAKPAAAKAAAPKAAATKPSAAKAPAPAPAKAAAPKSAAAKPATKAAPKAAAKPAAAKPAAKATAPKAAAAKPAAASAAAKPAPKAAAPKPAAPKAAAKPAAAKPAAAKPAAAKAAAPAKAAAAPKADAKPTAAKKPAGAKKPAAKTPAKV